MDVKNVRKDFPILSTKRNNKPLVYLDSAATSQKPNQVIDAISTYYKTYNANIHRGLYEISIKATEAYTESKEKVARLINANSYRNIVYCKNTTEAINLVALSWAESNIRENDHILLTKMEHHSNMVPWQLLAKRKKAIIDYVNLIDSSILNIDDYKEKLNLNPKLVSFSHVSNVLGTINNAQEITNLAHKNGAKVLIDAAQSVPHMPVDVKKLDCDFMAFSSHKMLGPSGIGVLYGKEDLLEEMPPIFGGGDMIRSVDFSESTWNELPWKFEAGTSNIEGGIGFGAAIDYLQNIGMSNIHQHEIELTQYALKRMSELGYIKVHGLGIDKSSDNNRSGVISFTMDKAHPHDIASIFDSQGIAIRAGHHCAMPLVNKVIMEPAVARASFYLYNTKEEIDQMINAFEKVKSILKIQL
jgi:cysteine desulfurase/selenocysteine lyase